jgi:5-(carboxyamino)imidazole ribonucleotide mutase
MGSRSDWETLSGTAEVLDQLGVPYEVRVVSAHRTPDLLFEYAASAEGRGIEVIVAGAGGAAHLPGMVASKTILPVLGVPVQSHALQGLDSLLSIVQMPAGVPVGTLAIGKAGARNAGLLAASIVAQGPARGEGGAPALAGEADRRGAGAPRSSGARLKVAVLGGGQLAQMMALAGTPLGMSFTFLDPAPDAPAGSLGRHVRSVSRTPRGLDAIGQWADVVTWDFENVPAASARRLGPPGCRLSASPLPGGLAGPRGGEGVPALPGDPRSRLRARGLEREPAGSGGVDRHAVRPQDAPPRLRREGAAPGARGGRGGGGLEGAGAPAGGARSFRPLHARAVRGGGPWPGRRRGLLPAGREPARGGDPAPDPRPRPRAHAQPAAPGRGLRGADAGGARLRRRAGARAIPSGRGGWVDGGLLANEFAPRVHNSGHWTIEGARTSQFENHLRAVAGLLWGRSIRWTAAPW